VPDLHRPQGRALRAPVAAIDIAPEICRRLTGVVFDVDDTLTDHGVLTAPAYAALWRLAGAGLHLVAVTGRPLGWCDVLARAWPVAAAVGENGAGWVFRAGERLRESYAEDAATRAEQRRRLALLEARALGLIPGLRLASDQRHRRTDLAFDVAEETTLPGPALQRLLGLIAEAGARSLVSSVHAHAFFGAHDKASGATRAIGEALGLAVEPERWLAVGDSGNDAALFAHFPVSAGVANVRAHLDRLPVPPAFIATHERGRGFAEIAEAVLLHRPA
jgi:HAD superfamily hydrolase (TIGR01484 family)